MVFDELKQKLATFSYSEKRADDAEYFEGVIDAAQRQNMCACLENFLGKPVWPSNGDLPEHIEEAIQDLGGVWENQMLYFGGDSPQAVFAMLWPWSDGKHITVKVGLK
ncbi:MAG TPA: hypothetical protein PKL77_02495 [Candidatus Omnitrophota bacterium]|nr:hypothetical protein [Candidatus Omnitrophota bacterium]HPT07029.1 hypothetical protein [Candidatus Omnitrophota bacterium]